jgi:hypothetical protein
MRWLVPASLLLAAVSLGPTPDPGRDALTGILHRNKGLFLKIDGADSFPVQLHGDVLNGVPDGARVWVKGEIHSWLYGQPASSARQQPIHWIVSMDVAECVPVNKPFELPSAQQRDDARRAYEQQRRRNRNADSQPGPSSDPLAPPPAPRPSDMP